MYLHGSDWAESGIGLTALFSQGVNLSSKGCCPVHLLLIYHRLDTYGRTDRNLS